MKKRWWKYRHESFPILFIFLSTYRKNIKNNSSDVKKNSLKETKRLKTFEQKMLIENWEEIIKSEHKKID